MSNPPFTSCPVMSNKCSLHDQIQQAECKRKQKGLTTFHQKWMILPSRPLPPKTDSSLQLQRSYACRRLINLLHNRNSLMIDRKPTLKPFKYLIASLIK